MSTIMTRPLWIDPERDVPVGVHDDVTATCTDGVLGIRVPVDKGAEAPAKVPITRL
jgi:hypothetical protein